MFRTYFVIEDFSCASIDFGTFKSYEIHSVIRHVEGIIRSASGTLCYPLSTETKLLFLIPTVRTRKLISHQDMFNPSGDKHYY